MKTAFTLLLFSLFTLPAIAQQGDNQERQDQMPPPVTEREVEKNAKSAQEERSRNEEAQKKEETRKNDNEKSNSAAVKPKNTTAGKTSNTPEKQ